MAAIEDCMLLVNALVHSFKLPRVTLLVHYCARVQFFAACA